MSSLTTEQRQELKNSNYRTRRKMAKAYDTTPEQLTELSKDKRLKVRCTVATSDNTPPESLAADLALWR